MGMPAMRRGLEEAQAQVEGGIMSAFDEAWDSMKSEEKGKFQGYSKNTISGRAERAGKARAWNQSRKVKRGRTRKRYARNKTRGNVRPAMRRQLGAGGSRKETKR